MDVLQFLGCLGGVCYLLCFILQSYKKVMKLYRDYTKYRYAYEEQQQEPEKPPMGFKTKQEKEEIEARYRR